MTADRTSEVTRLVVPEASLAGWLSGGSVEINSVPSRTGSHAVAALGARTTRTDNALGMSAMTGGIITSHQPVIVIDGSSGTDCPKSPILSGEHSDGTSTQSDLG